MRKNFLKTTALLGSKLQALTTKKPAKKTSFGLTFTATAKQLTKGTGGNHWEGGIMGSHDHVVND